jgi:hypothetical protein
MKSLLIITSLVLSTFFCHCQTYQTSSIRGISEFHSATGKVAAKSGLIVRSEPSTNSSMVSKIPFNSIVSMYTSSQFPSETIEGVQAPWVKVCHKGKCGYAFSGFIQDQREYDILFADMFAEGLPMKNTDYVAVCEDDELGYYSKVLEGETILTNGWIDADKFDTESVVFAVRGISSPGRLHDGWTGAQCVLPGELVELGKLQVFARGNSVVTATGVDLVNYSLHTWELNRDFEVSEALVLQDVEAIAGPRHGIPIIVWSGDLDSDGEADLIVRIQSSYGETAALLLTSVAEPGSRFRCVAKTVVYYCCMH